MLFMRYGGLVVLDYPLLIQVFIKHTQVAVAAAVLIHPVELALMEVEMVVEQILF